MVEFESSHSGKLVASQWLERLERLERALVQRGRENLAIVAITPLRQLMGRASSGEATLEPAMDLIGKAFVELKDCVVQIDKLPNLALFDEITRLARPKTLPPPPPEGETIRDSFVQTTDADLERLLDAVGGSTAKKSSTRAKARDDLGTLREPYSNESAAGVAATEPADGGRVLMKGELHPQLVTDLIQLFSQNGETGMLYVESQGKKASAYFNAGAIVDAECGELSGEPAFFELMMMRDGRFSYQRGVSSTFTRIHRRTQHLLMETLRRIDETA